jgi:hypothetical protein
MMDRDWRSKEMRGHKARGIKKTLFLDGEEEN